MRGGNTPKRKAIPDPRYNSERVAKLITYIMRGGKKTVAQRVVYDALALIQEKAKKDPMEVFELAFKNVSPEVEVKSRRVGGGNYQVPMPVMGDRKIALTYRWIIAAAKSRKGIPMRQKLAMEFMDAAAGTGAAVKKREDVYRMAEANRAFAHFGRPRKKK
jgi:small subunit ribosomal protein S7